MIGLAGVDRAPTVTLHADQIQGFFGVPVDNVYASPVLLGEVWKQKYDNMIVVSPDVGGVVRARALARRLDNADLAIIDKRRQRANESQVMNIIGDVRGRSCILVDDLVDTAGTLCQAAQALKDEGAARVIAYITHPVLSGKAVERIGSSALDQLVVTDASRSARRRGTASASASCRSRSCWRKTMAADRDEESVSSAVRGLGGVRPSEGSRRGVRRRRKRIAGAWSRAN